MDGYVVISTELDTKSFDAQIDYVESQLKEIEDKLKQADMGFEVGDTQKLEAQYEKLIQKLTTLKKKQADLNKIDLSNVQKSIDKIGNSTTSTIKKVSKWALAVFSVRSAYMLVRRAVSTLSQYNEDLANKLEGIQLVLASALEPLITRLVNLAYKLLYYLNYITKAWFNIDLFSSANEKALNNSAKSAEKMRKSLAGFDEMNVIQDTSTTTGATTGVTIPTMEDVEIPSWLQWIVDNKDLVIAGLIGIAGGLTAVNLGLSGIKGLGIGIALTGIVLTITSILAYLKEPTWENFGKIITGIGLAVAGVAIAFGALPVALVALGVALYGIIVANWEKIKGFFLNIATWLEEHLGLFGEFLGSIIRGFTNNFEELFEGIKQIFDGIIKIAKGDFAGGLKSIFKGLINTIIGGLNTLINGLNIVIYPIRALITGIGKVLGKNWKLDNIKIPSIPKLAVGGIVNMPSRGVPVGGAIAGEAGREGVIPLTDSQAMETLGQAIGRYITINASITNTMNGRIISKELKRINNDSDFAFNK